MNRQAYTPHDLSERWQCSERHVRNLLSRGELQFFRLGGKLVRISQSAVEAFERGQGSELSSTEGNSPSTATRNHGAIGPPSGQTIVVTLDQRCDDLRPATDAKRRPKSRSERRRASREAL